MRRKTLEFGRVMHTCTTSHPKAEAGAWTVWGRDELQSEILLPPQNPKCLTVFELGTLRQGDCYEFEVGLGYRVSSGLTWGNLYLNKPGLQPKPTTMKPRKKKKGRKKDRQTNGRKDRQAWQDKEWWAKKGECEEKDCLIKARGSVAGPGSHSTEI